MDRVIVGPQITAARKSLIFNQNWRPSIQGDEDGTTAAFCEFMKRKWLNSDMKRLGNVTRFLADFGLKHDLKRAYGRSHRFAHFGKLLYLLISFPPSERTINPS
jgi:hypothetical protein